MGRYEEAERDAPTAREINQGGPCECIEPDCGWSYIRLCEWRADGCEFSFRSDEHPEWQGWIGDTETWVCGTCRKGVARAEA